MIKLVASDLDGTLLLKGAQSLPEDIFPLIRELKELGILFVAASGRQYANMKKLFSPVVNDIAFISENGGLAVYNEKILYQDSFDPKLVREIAESIYARDGAEFTCSTKDFYYLRPKTEHFRDLMNNVVKNNCREINSFDEMREPCMKMAVYESNGLQDETIRYWKERFGDRCTVVTSGNAWVDFIPFETNKAKGVDVYQKLLGISKEECVVFGDEYNDIAMLKSVPYSFAMAHAKEGVKKAASYETESVQTVLRKLIRAKGKIEEVIK
ncbi:HAD family hydrolase [Blautia sp. MSJ-19]|uniref:HAD family hydrolase n=1 Tax=Blautia sp. MSJ-19 TaxID=2841517 RepID=UPI001C0EEA40|nr:HAD family hydrolase [Blautia sp. MSJ-19]MBU5479931.1 HAD family hydrolase [Blautia sp. MSJ-19]